MAAEGLLAVDPAHHAHEQQQPTQLPAQFAHPSPPPADGKPVRTAPHQATATGSAERPPSRRKRQWLQTRRAAPRPRGPPRLVQLMASRAQDAMSRLQPITRPRSRRSVANSIMHIPHLGDRNRSVHKIGEALPSISQIVVCNDTCSASVSRRCISQLPALYAR